MVQHNLTKQTFLYASLKDPFDFLTKHTTLEYGAHFLDYLLKQAEKSFEDTRNTLLRKKGVPFQILPHKNLSLPSLHRFSYLDTHSLENAKPGISLYACELQFFGESPLETVLLLQDNEEKEIPLSLEDQDFLGKYQHHYFSYRFKKEEVRTSSFLLSVFYENGFYEHFDLIPFLKPYRSS